MSQTALLSNMFGRGRMPQVDSYTTCTQTEGPILTREGPRDRWLTIRLSPLLTAISKQVLSVNRGSKMAGAGIPQAHKNVYNNVCRPRHCAETLQKQGASGNRCHRALKPRLWGRERGFPSRPSEDSGSGTAPGRTSKTSRGLWSRPWPFSETVPISTPWAVIPASQWPSREQQITVTSTASSCPQLTLCNPSRQQQISFILYLLPFLWPNISISYPGQLWQYWLLFNWTTGTEGYELELEVTIVLLPAHWQKKQHSIKTDLLLFCIYANSRFNLSIITW